MINIFQSSSREAVLALVLGSSCILYSVNKKRIMTASSSSESAPSQPIPLKLIDASETFTEDELSALIHAWQDEKPEGKFLKGRHGTTHYVVDRHDNNSEKKGMVVLGHGLGSSLKVYKDFAIVLANEGYTVLRYDYFGHGYSKYNGEDMWIKYTPDVFVDQLEDLIDFISEEEQEDIIAYVGHSNGGTNAISANFRWSSKSDDGSSSRSVFPKVILVNPAIYANKPLLARISDKIPRFMTSLFKTIPLLQSLIGDNYLELMNKVFGKNPETNEYNFPEAFQTNMERNLRLFGRVKGVKEHPFLAASVVGVSSYNIPEAMLPLHREKLTKLLGDSSDNQKSSYLYLWSELDVSAPYEGNVDEVRNWTKVYSNLQLKSFSGLSHEIFLEDYAVVAEAVLPFLASQ